MYSKYIYLNKSKIKGAGIGLFADADIPKHTRIGIYNGKKINSDTFTNLRDKTYVWQINDNLFVDGNPKNYTDNHKILLSFANGAKTRHQRKKINTFAYIYRKDIYYKTLTDVKKGEEIIVDYGKYYWI